MPSTSPLGKMELHMLVVALVASLVASSYAASCNDIIAGGSWDVYDVTLPATTSGSTVTFQWQNSWGTDRAICYTFRTPGSSYAYLALTGYQEGGYDWSYVWPVGYDTSYIHLYASAYSGGTNAVASYSDYIFDYSWTQVLQYRTGLDVTPPTITVPSSVWTVEATSSSGATVTLTDRVSGADMANANIANPAPTFTCVSKPNNDPLAVNGALFALDTTDVVCTASDRAGNVNTDEADGTFSVRVQDTTAPEVTVLTPNVVEATSSAGANYELSTRVSATDAVTASPTITCKMTSDNTDIPITGHTFAVGTTSVTCSATDSHSNTSPGTTFNVVVQDTTNPSLTAAATITADLGVSIVLSDYFTATDTVSTPTITCTAAGVNIPVSGHIFAVPGTVTLTCIATDAAGNTAPATTTVVTVQDDTPPTLTVADSVVVEAATAVSLSAFLTATDDVSTPTITCTVGGDSISLASYVFALGTTSVTCSASDAAGHVSPDVTFDVVGQDTTPPLLTVSRNPITMTSADSSGATIVLSTYLTVRDAASTPTVTCKIVPSNTDIPLDGFLFPMGLTMVECVATDGAGIRTINPFRVRVIAAPVGDITPPAVTVGGGLASLTFEAESQNGKTLGSFPVTATDDVDSSPRIKCYRTSDGEQVPLNGFRAPLGQSTYLCTATDKAGNTATSDPLDIIVHDTTAPVLTVPSSDVVVEATYPGGKCIKLPVSAKDAVDTVPTITCVLPDYGSYVLPPSYCFPVATTVVSCTAKDADENESAPQSFNVDVQDTTEPTVRVAGPLSFPATSRLGARVALAKYVSAWDAVTKKSTLGCKLADDDTPLPLTGYFFPLGTTRVICTAVDAKLNEGSSEPFDVEVNDETAPTVTVPGSISVTAPKNANGALVKLFRYVSAKDAMATLKPTLTCTLDDNTVVPLTGYTFPIGTTSVTCTATDAAGNVGTGVTSVIVAAGATDTGKGIRAKGPGILTRTPEERAARAQARKEKGKVAG